MHWIAVLSLSMYVVPVPINKSWINKEINNTLLCKTAKISCLCTHKCAFLETLMQHVTGVSMSHSTNNTGSFYSNACVCETTAVCNWCTEWLIWSVNGVDGSLLQHHFNHILSVCSIHRSVMCHVCVSDWKGDCCIIKIYVFEALFMHVTICKILTFTEWTMTKLDLLRLSEKREISLCIIL